MLFNKDFGRGWAAGNEQIPYCVSNKMHTHCKGLTSAYLHSAHWHCVTAVWLLSSGCPPCLHLSSSTSKEKLTRAVGSFLTAALLLQLAICCDGLGSFTWVEPFKNKSSINPSTKKRKLCFHTLETIKDYTNVIASCLIYIQKTVHTLTERAFWWVRSCVTGLM